jgi:hypothetical protein
MVYEPDAYRHARPLASTEALQRIRAVRERLARAAEAKTNPNPTEPQEGPTP